MGLARQEAASHVYRQVWTRTDPWLGAEPEPLAGYLDLLPTLGSDHVAFPVAYEGGYFIG